MQGSKANLNDAIANLAAWMELAQDHPTEDDWAVLGDRRDAVPGGGKQAAIVKKARDAYCL